ncbi:MAG: sugar kinase [SAR324 cluster bacterium]|nr:sugar kinase [SAR324 cluster bacterium]
MSRIVCIGVAVMDQIFRLKELPLSAGKYFAEDYIEVGGGPAATAAVTIARLGGEVEFWGRVGADEIGNRILAELNEYGVNTQYVKRIDSSPSSISAVLVDQSGERLIVGRPVPGMDSDPSWLPLERIASQHAVLADSAWSRGAEIVLKKARENNIPAILDADSTRDNKYFNLIEAASHIIFSENGLKSTSGIEEIAPALQAVRKGSHSLVGVTQGGSGTYWLEKDQLHHQAAFSVEVIDTLGAGDVFHGALALAIAEKQPIPQAIQFASAAAALKCRLPGGRAGIPDRETVETLIRKETL